MGVCRFAPGRYPLLTLAATLALLPVVNPSKTLLIQILIWGLFAVSYNILLGYTGLLSFGHAIFFGIGSYAAGLFLKQADPSLLGALALGALVPTLAAVGIAWLSLRRRGVYVSMLTLAFVPLESLGGYTGGAVLMMTILGGKGTFVGPFVGAGVYWALQDFLANVTDSWPLLVGAIFMLCVVVLPRGIAGTVAGWGGGRAPAQAAEGAEQT